MMVELIDFSWARPGASAIKDAGYKGVIRYLSDDTSGKNLSAPERDEYFAAGLSVRLVYENGTQAALGGQAQGLKDGQDALHQAQALGLPKGFGIYYAIDFEATADQMAAVAAYGAGFAQGLGAYYACAPYGGYSAVNAASKSWQTCAWSAGQVYEKANLYQNGVVVFGGSADEDQLLIDDGWDWTSVSGNAPTEVPTPVAPVSHPTPASAPGPGGTHSVASGDTLSSIGRKLGVDWQALAQLNNICAPYTIYPGEVLLVPGSTPAPSCRVTTQYSVRSGDTLSSIGAKFGISYEAIAAANGISNPNNVDVGQVLVIPAGASAALTDETYTVGSGDTLSIIGVKEGINWLKIAELNNLVAPYVIYPGQVLKLNSLS
jgi:LysM repeat protein